MYISDNSYLEVWIIYCSNDLAVIQSALGPRGEDKEGALEDPKRTQHHKPKCQIHVRIQPSFMKYTLSVFLFPP